MTNVGMRRLMRDPWVVSGLLAFIMAAVVLLLLGDGLGVRVGGLLLVVSGHAYFLWQLGRQRLSDRPPNEARLWRFLAVTSVMWAVARLFQASHVLARSRMPDVPSFADLALLAGSLAAVGAIIRDPFPLNPRKGEVRDLLETAVIGIGTMMLFWLTVVSPALDVGFDSEVTVAWLGVAPAIDLVLVVLLLRLIFQSTGGGERVVLALLAVAFLARVPADLAVGYGVLRGAAAVDPAAELGWVLSPLAMALSARMQVARRASEHEIDPRTESFSHRLGNWLPFAVTYLVAGFTLASWWLVGAVNWVGAVTAAGLGLLLVARQGVIAGQAEMRQYATLVEGAGNLAFVCDPRGELLLSNPALERAIGRSVDRSPEFELSQFLEGPPPVEELLEDALDNGWSGEVSLRSAHGGWIPVALTLRPVFDERRSELVLAGTAHDLTELKRRERELRRALQDVARAREELQQLNESLEAKVEDRTQELETTVARLEQLNEELKELDRLKSEFVTLVSHELRAPLTNIRSGVELLLNGSKPLLPSVEETLEVVASETERLVEFVEMILDLSALEAGRFPTSPEPLELGPLVREVVDRFPTEVGAGRIALEIEDDLPRASADEKSIMSVMFHLVDNALKYAPNGPITVRAEADGETVRVAVSDQGPGIPESERESVFDRFYRLDTTDAREVYGWGLGLHLSRRLIEVMGGDIRIADSPSGGAEFAFWLARADS